MENDKSAPRMEQLVFSTPPPVSMTSATTAVSLHRYGALSYFGAVVVYKPQGVAPVFSGLIDLFLGVQTALFQGAQGTVGAPDINAATTTLPVPP